MCFQGKSVTKLTKTNLVSHLGARLRKTNINHGLTTFSSLAPLKWHLVLLVAGSLLPVALFAIFVVHKLSTEARAASEHRMLLAARELSQDVEREVSTTARTLQSLAASEQLDKGNLKAFHAEVRRAAMTQPTWLTVILLTPDGHQVVNTSRPFGVPLPKVYEPESLQRVVETRQTTVGYLFRGRLGEGWAFPIRVPVMSTLR